MPMEVPCSWRGSRIRACPSPTPCSAWACTPALPATWPCGASRRSWWVRKDGAAPTSRPLAGACTAAAAALATGVLKGSVREALEYAKQRRQGGREIVNWSEVRMILANMAIAAQSADLLVEVPAGRWTGRNPVGSSPPAAAAIKAMDMACDATTDGIQLLGGNGYMVEYHQEKRFRDAKQIQALLGMTPMKKLEYVKRIIDEGLPW